MDLSRLDDEVGEVRRRYQRRHSNALDSVYHPVRLDRVLLRHRKELLITRHLRDRWLTNLDEVHVLEVGCGPGTNLGMFLNFGIPPRNLTGVELLEERVEQARQLLPTGINVKQGDATRAGFDTESFNIIIQSTVFSSILAPYVRMQLAEEMWRWLRPGGSILWYDLAYDNPRNPDVSGISRKEVKALFPKANLEIHRITLAPPIARRIVRGGALLYRALETIPFLRSHLLIWATKPD